MQTQLPPIFGQPFFVSCTDAALTIFTVAVFRKLCCSSEALQAQLPPTFFTSSTFFTFPSPFSHLSATKFSYFYDPFFSFSPPSFHHTVFTFLTFQPPSFHLSLTLSIQGLKSPFSFLLHAKHLTLSCLRHPFFTCTSPFSPLIDFGFHRLSVYISEVQTLKSIRFFL